MKFLVHNATVVLTLLCCKHGSHFVVVSTTGLVAFYSILVWVLPRICKCLVFLVVKLNVIYPGYENVVL